MLRSMLYVRYGSACRGRQTASAARPSEIRSLSKSATPSSAVRRLPLTALSRMYLRQEFTDYVPLVLGIRIDPQISQFLGQAVGTLFFLFGTLSFVAC